MTNPPQGAQISLQKVTQKRYVRTNRGQISSVTTDNYIFQAIELPSGNLKLVINTEKDDSFRELLLKLFDAISRDIDREGVDFLKKIID